MLTSFVHYLSSALLNSPRSVMFCIKVAGHYFVVLKSFMLWVLVDEPLDFLSASEGVTGFVESGLVLPFPRKCKTLTLMSFCLMAYVGIS